MAVPGGLHPARVGAGMWLCPSVPAICEHPRGSGPYFFGFHSRASFSASDIWAAVILLAT